MIEEFYAAHIKDRLDTSLINVKRSKPPTKQRRKKTPDSEGPEIFVADASDLA